MNKFAIIGTIIGIIINIAPNSRYWRLFGMGIVIVSLTLGNIQRKRRPRFEQIKRR